MFGVDIFSCCSGRASLRSRLKAGGGEEEPRGLWGEFQAAGAACARALSLSCSCITALWFAPLQAGSVPGVWPPRRLWALVLAWSRCSDTASSFYYCCSDQERLYFHVDSEGPGGLLLGSGSRCTPLGWGSPQHGPCPSS